MCPVPSLPVEWRERRIVLLGELSALLEQSQVHLMGKTPAVLESLTERQRRICEALQQVQHSFPGDLGAELARAEQALQHRALVYAFLLRKVRRTQFILAQALQANGKTYSPLASEKRLPWER